MCQQVVIAALYYNPTLLFETLGKIQRTDTSEHLVDHFVKMWLGNIEYFMGLHDRKMCVLGLCTLISSQGSRPQSLTEMAPQVVPSLLVLFDGLKRAYAYRAQEDEETDEEEDDDEEYDGDGLESDEDEIDDEGQEYLARLARKAKKGSPFPITSATIEDDQEEDDDDEDDDDEVETPLESFTTPLDEEDCPVDEYQVFKDVMQAIQGADPMWYNALTSSLSGEQQKSMQEVYILADQRRAAAESRRIEKSGGYVFQNQTVPTSFNFGGTPLC